MPHTVAAAWTLDGGYTALCEGPLYRLTHRCRTSKPQTIATPSISLGEPARGKNVSSRQVKPEPFALSMGDPLQN